MIEWSLKLKVIYTGSSFFSLSLSLTGFATHRKRDCVFLSCCACFLEQSARFSLQFCSAYVFEPKL